MKENLYQSFVEKNNLLNEELDNNRNECIKFISCLISYLSTYIDCQKDRIVWVDISKEMQKSIALDTDFLGFYNFGKLALYKTGLYKFLIRIFLGPNDGTSDAIQIHFRIKKNNNGFTLYDEKKEITDNAAEHLENISKNIVENIFEIIDNQNKLIREKNPLGFILKQPK